MASAPSLRHPLRAAQLSFRSFTSAISSIWGAGGIASLFAGTSEQFLLCVVAKLSLDPGNGLNVVKMLPEGATKFGCYEVSILNDIGGRFY